MGLYLVESFIGANICAKLAFVFLLVAEILGWIAFTTTDWGKAPGRITDDTGYGLWRMCAGLGCTALDGWLLEWYGVVQAFAILGFVSLNLGFLLVILFVFAAPCKCNSDLSFWNAINCFAGAICWLITVIIFGAEGHDKFGDSVKLSYSFILAIIALAFMIAAGIVLLLTNRGGVAVSSK